MKKVDYEKYIAGFAITDCIILNKDFLIFIVYEAPSEGYSSMGEYSFKYVTYKLDLEKVGHRGWAGGSYYLNIEYDHKEKKTVLVDLHGKAWESMQPLEAFPLYELPNKDSTFSIHDLKSIDGNIYAVGQPRKLLKRIKHKEWVDLTTPEQHPYLQKEIFEAKKKGEIFNLNFGFNSVDGFNKNDIYTCGDGGDMWHYNGTTWHIIDFPSNIKLSKLLCTKDGYVYVIGETGKLYKGRNDKWSLVNQQITQSDFIDITYFKKILYIATEGGLYQLKDHIFSRVSIENNSIGFSFNGICSNDDILVVYNTDRVSTFDGSTWKIVIQP